MTSLHIAILVVFTALSACVIALNWKALAAMRRADPTPDIGLASPIALVGPLSFLAGSGVLPDEWRLAIFGGALVVDPGTWHRIPGASTLIAKRSDRKRAPTRARSKRPGER